MKLLNELYAIDVAFLPIGDRYTMGVDDAIRATDWIRPKWVVPIHYDTRPPIKADAMDFARRVMLDNYAVPKILTPGQAIVLS
jgi:L-ascorbate metabolism protein UlaG (beta-lactamase superfamily)